MYKRVSARIIAGIMLLNLIAIVACVRMGLDLEDVSFLFQEREAITFLSALQLGFISLLSIVTYSIKRLLYRGIPNGLKSARVWLISFFGFAFASADEFFMIHEGLDGDIATYFWGIRENPHLDGITLALYGVVALFLFFKVKRIKEELLKHRQALFLLFTSGFFFIASLLFDLGSVKQFQIILEESAKFIAVGLIFSGFVFIFSDILEELKTKLP